MLIAEARKKLTQHVETRGGDAAAGARVHALGEHLRHPSVPTMFPRSDVVSHKPLVVAGFGIEANDQTRRADARGKRLDVRRQVRTAAFLAGFDQHDAARVRNIAEPRRAAIAVSEAKIA